MNNQKSNFNYSITNALTLCGAVSSAILALVIIPNCPRPPRTAWNNSEFCSSEQVSSSPLPVVQICHVTFNKFLNSKRKGKEVYICNVHTN